MNQEESLTVVVSRTVRPGRELDYERWLRGIGEVAHHFAGHLGVTVIRPTPSSREYSLIFRFDTLEHLRAWQDSSVCRDWVAIADNMCEGSEVQELSGMETWFTLPGMGKVLPPPRWKMAVVSWLVAFPLIQVLNATIGAWLRAAPTLVRGALSGLAMILLMTYVVMPLVTLALARWLYPRGTTVLRPDEVHPNGVGAG